MRFFVCQNISPFFFPQLSTRFPLPCVKKVLFQEAGSLEISLLLGENLSQSLLFYRNESGSENTREGSLSVSASDTFTSRRAPRWTLPGEFRTGPPVSGTVRCGVEARVTLYGIPVTFIKADLTVQTASAPNPVREVR